MNLEFRGPKTALAWFRRSRAEPPPGPAGRTDRALALALCALLYAIYLATFSGTYHSSDEKAMLVATDSLARRGAWDVELLRWMGQQQGSFGPDGHLYSRKGIGMTLAALPPYWIALQFERLGNVQAGMLTNALVTALTALLVFLSLRRLHFGQGVATLTTLAFGLGTMAWPYARYFFSEPLAALGLILSFYFLLRYRDLADPLSVTLAGAGLGIALLARLNNALAAPFLGLLLLAYLYRHHRRRWQGYITPVLLFGLPVLAALAITGWYNWIRFGDVLTTGYLPEENFSTPFFEGLYGLTFSAGKGLFWYNPLLIAAAAAWPTFYQRTSASDGARYRAEALLIAAIVLSTLFFYAPWYLWWAGHGWGPRFLVSLLPFATLPLAAAIDLATRHRPLAVALAILAAMSVAVQMLGVAVNYNLYLEDVHAELGLYHPATLFDPAYSPLVRQWGYLGAGRLDVAWAQLEPAWKGILYTVPPVLLALFACWAAWARKPFLLSGGWLLLLLAGYTLPSLLAVGPVGDLPAASRKLDALDRPGEAAVLAGQPWLLAEAFQDAYDGRLPIWGVQDRAAVPAGYNGTWVVTAGEPDPSPLRFQAGDVALAFCPAPGQAFDAARLPALLPGSGRALGGVVELLGAEPIKDRVGCGSHLPITLWWRALAPVDTSYTLFIQVIDEEGTKAGQVDRLPCGGTCPTTTWQPGDVVGERYELDVDCAAPQGPYQVIAGMYDLETGARLPLLDAAGNRAGDYLVLGTVHVQ
ncbi:MAG: phospholipid carrier-dependent glycosyltransferase [Anaerolineae bacterium]|nr:phospholipid carrier-dependent glycosyltransferase [Anaerolineae bacterium]